MAVACIEEIGEEEESNDARNEQRSGDVNPGGVNGDGRNGETVPP